MDPIHHWICPACVIEAVEDSVYSNLHCFHLFIDRSSFTYNTAADICWLFCPLRNDLCNSRSKLDAGWKGVKWSGKRWRVGQDALSRNRISGARSD